MNPLVAATTQSLDCHTQLLELFAAQKYHNLSYGLDNQFQPIFCQVTLDITQIEAFNFC